MPAASSSVDAAAPQDASQTPRADTAKPMVAKDTAPPVQPPVDAAVEPPQPKDTAPVMPTVDAIVAKPDASAPPGSLPAGWMVETIDDRFDSNHKDDGANGYEGPYTKLDCRGTAGYSDGTFSMSACGLEVWHGRDYFTYVYRALDGDGEVSAKIDSVQAGQSAKFGVMLRNEPLFKDPDQPGAMVFYQNGAVTWGDRIYSYDPNNGRAGDGWGPGPSTATLKNVTLPIYVKVRRTKKDHIEGYYSRDGKEWTLVPAGGSGDAINDIKEHTDRVWVGIFGAPTKNGVLVDAKFSEVTVSPL